MSTRRQENKLAKQEAYLTVLVKTGTVRSACEAAGVTRASVTHWRNSEVDGEDFVERENAAMAEFADTLLEEAVTRGRDGWHEPVIHQGEQRYARNPFTGEILLDDDLEPIPLTVLKKSDQVLIKLLEAKVPGFQRNGVTVGLPDGGGGSVPSKITIEFVESDGDGREAGAA